MTSRDVGGEDYYAILGVTPTADAKTIRKAYLKLSLQYHPDKNVDDPVTAQAAFVRIGQAYQVLSDPTQRAIYDATYRKKKPNHHYYSSAAPQTPHSTSSGTTGSSPPMYQSAAPPNPSDFQEGFGGASSATQQQQYETYRDAFDATMASLSEEELQEVLGAAALLSSVIGSLLGSRFVGGPNAHPVVKSLGAAVGAAVARQATTSFLQSSHAQAKERAALQADSRSSAPSVDDQRRRRDLPQNKPWHEHFLNDTMVKEVGSVIQQVASDFLSKPRTASATKY